MALTNREIIGRTLEHLHKGLVPYVKRELETKRVRAAISSDPTELLGLMLEHWQNVFSERLGPLERTLVFELKSFRNKWAHMDTLTWDDAERVLDSAARLLDAVGSTAEAEIARDNRMKLMQQRMESRAQKKAKRVAESATKGAQPSTLKCWRDVIAPHKDVRDGKYQEATFAADLFSVYEGNAADEYGDPQRFFERTFLTEGLKALLQEGIKRICGEGGIPVFELQTHFGGGKTHNLLALYHLFSGVKPDLLVGVPELMKELKIETLPEVNKAVIVGTRGLSPGQPSKKKDGCEVHTVWGEIAWQLGGKKGYELVRKSDETGTNPANALGEVFENFSPCMILLDEWVAYARQLRKEDATIGGTFETQMTFAQTLTEAAKAAPRTLLVISLPESEKEIGGELGEKAHEVIKNILSRIDSPWHPAAPEESFEIVRRRLFQTVEDGAARDAVCRAYSDMYQKSKADFPTGTGEKSYMERMQRCYPIHPELFDRLYSDWAALENFQQTRGVLRLMAKVIQTLHELDDKNLLIMPGMVPLFDDDVQKELLRYLDNPWKSVLGTDVDGPNVTSHKIDDASGSVYGRYHACRRVARTLFLGSAPTIGRPNQGLEDKQIRLGCVQPGEAVPTFGDALKRLSEQALHLYMDKQRYWFDTKRSVNRLALERAEQKTDDDVWQEVQKRLEKAKTYRGSFKRVHPCPPSSGDVPDDMDAKLVILSPEHVHVTKNGESDATKVASEILDNRGNSPRRYRNTLVFLAADKKERESLIDAVKKYLAWDSIFEEKGEEALNLDAYQANQAKSKRDEISKTVEQRIKTAYKWLLIPEQPEPDGPEGWRDKSIKTDGHLAENASKRLESDEELVSKFGHTNLRADLDNIPLWRGNHVALSELQEFYASYLYLNRMKDASVVLDAARNGVQSMHWTVEAFAYAESYDEKTGKYVGLKPDGKKDFFSVKDGMLVKAEIALEQLDAAEPDIPKPGTSPIPKTTPEPDAPKYRRFHGRKKLDALRWSRDVDTVWKQLVQKFNDLEGADVDITIEIEVNIPDGLPDKLRMDITEDCNSLKVEGGFEED